MYSCIYVDPFGISNLSCLPHFIAWLIQLPHPCATLFLEHVIFSCLFWHKNFRVDCQFSFKSPVEIFIDMDLNLIVGFGGKYYLKTFESSYSKMRLCLSFCKVFFSCGFLMFPVQFSLRNLRSYLLLWMSLLKLHFNCHWHVGKLSIFVGSPNWSKWILILFTFWLKSKIY